MAVSSEGLRGPRLSFAVREIPGMVLRHKYTAPPTKAEREKNPKKNQLLSNTISEVYEPAGYLVFLPTGNSYRLSPEQLVRYGFDQEPNILSFEQANDNRTAAGRFKLARTERARQKAWKEMEEELIRHCVGRYGDYKSLVNALVPEGFVEEKETAE